MENINFVNGFIKKSSMTPNGYLKKLTKLVLNKKYIELNTEKAKNMLIGPGHYDLAKNSPKHLRGELYNQLRRLGKKKGGIYNDSHPGQWGFRHIHGEISQDHPIRNTINKMREYSSKK